MKHLLHRAFQLKQISEIQYNIACMAGLLEWWFGSYAGGWLNSIIEIALIHVYDAWFKDPEIRSCEHIQVPWGSDKRSPTVTLIL